MKKKSELMNALKELTEKRLLTSEVEALFEPYQDAVFPLVLSFVSAERSFGSQKDEKYNGGYKVLCIAENWGIGVALLFEPEDNHLVESFDSSQEFEANVRFIDYDSLYQRAIFGKLDSEPVPSEEDEVISSPREEMVEPSTEEKSSSPVQEKVMPPKEDYMVPEEENSITDSDPEDPESVTEEPEKSTDENGEIWNWEPDNEEDQKMEDTQGVSDSDPVQSDTDSVKVPVQPPKKDDRYVYEEEESYLYEDESVTAKAGQESPQPIGCSKGCMQTATNVCYILGALLMFGSCVVIDEGGDGGGTLFLGFVLVGIGYLIQKSKGNGDKDNGYIN